MPQLCICDGAANRPQKADDVLVMLLSAVVASQKGRSSLLTKGNAAAKTILSAFFDSAHDYAAQHVAHSAAASCVCLACLGCRCSACESAETEAASDSSGDEGNASDSDGDEDDAKSECDLCGKQVKDLARHQKRLHAVATATDSDRDEGATDDERKQWQARLEAAEQAEQKAANLARRAQQEKAVAEAKAMAASAPIFAAASPAAAVAPVAAGPPPASAVVKEQPDAGAAPDDSFLARAPSPEDMDPASSSANASEQPFPPAALSLPADLEQEQPQHGMSLAWADHEDTHTSWQRSHQQRQWAREQVANVGLAIQTDMVSALSSQATPSSAAAMAVLDTSSLQTTLSFAPGRESAALAPLQAVALYQDQSRFGRKIDLMTRFVAGRLARSFYAHEGGPNVKQAAAARQTAASGASLDFEAFCVQVLGAYARVVRAEVWFAALCDLSPGLLPALCRHAELFRWADFTLQTALFFDEWKSWLSHNGFLLPSLIAPSARASLPLVCPHCGAKVAQQTTLARHLSPNPPQSCLNKRAKSSSPEPESQDAKAPGKRKSSDDDTLRVPPKKARLKEGEDSSETKVDEAAPCPLATVHLQTIRRYDAPLLRISDVVDTPAFREKQLLPVRFTESAFRSAMATQRPFLATDVPVTYRGHDVLPSIDDLVAQLRGTLGRTIEKVDVHDGETRSEWLYVKAALDTWTASGSQYLPADQLGNVVAGKADTFVKRFAFGGGLDSGNALREQKKDLRAVTLSPRGAFTNTHWDEYAAVTYYLQGLKFWMFIDADEAKHQPGIRDTSSLSASAANSPASFSLSAFCRMRKAWWALTGAGQLVACPEGMLHRVTTLEKTFGVTFNYESRKDA